MVHGSLSGFGLRRRRNILGVVTTNGRLTRRRVRLCIEYY